MKLDLHNHTNHSDGIYTPLELVERAIANGVDVFALTDHDSVFGIEEINSIAKNKNVKIINGMELSTYYKGESVHIVCLFKNNIVPKEIYDFSNTVLEKRKARAILMMNKIKDIYNVKIDLDELLKDQVITRANMLRNIAKCNNLSEREASFYVSKDSKAYIPSTKMSVIDGLKLAREANCFCIFAHPCLIEHRQYVEEILKFGFDGIEVRYPSTKNDEAYFTKLAKKYKLCISAGSDCHGDEKHADIGTMTLNEEEFEPIRKALDFKL